MKEIEVIVIEINISEITKKLLDLGAKKIFEGKIYSKTYDFENKDLKKLNSKLRLRKKGDKVILTLKKQLEQKEARIAEEIELEVEDFEKMESIFFNIGLLDRTENTKKRTSFKIQDVLFEIDEYDNIPPLMEIEAPDVETINHYVEKLGIDKNNVKNWNGKELREHYGVNYWGKKSR